MKNQLRDRDSEIERYKRDLDDWRNKYSALEMQFSNYKSSSGGESERLNGLLRDRENDINRLQSELRNTIDEWTSKYTNLEN